MYSIDDMQNELSKLNFPKQAQQEAVEVTKKVLNPATIEERSILFWNLLNRFALLQSTWWRDFFREDILFGSIVKVWDKKF